MIDPITLGIVGAGSGLVSSIVGGLFGSSNQSSANATNIKLAQMNNDFQASQLEKQMAYNTEMWNKQNAYNTPSAQVQRLKAAGLNPYLMLNGGSAGQAQSANGVTPGQGTPAHVESYDPSSSFSAIGETLGKVSDFFMRKQAFDSEVRKNNSEAEGNEIDNTTRAAKNIAEIDKTKQETKSSKTRAALDAITTDLKKATFDSQVERSRLENEQLRSNINLTGVTITSFQLDNELKKLNIKNYDKRLAAELSLMAAQTYSNYMGGNLSESQSRLAEQQAKFAVQQSAESVLRQKGITLDNKQKSQLMPLLVNTAKYNVLSARYGSESSKNNRYANNFWQMFHVTQQDELGKLPPIYIKR